MDYLDQARVFKAFCDETRLKVLYMLKEEELCACVLLEHVNISQSTLSHHMKILVDSGVVNERKEGKWKYYSLNASGGGHAQHLLQELFEEADE